MHIAFASLLLFFFANGVYSACVQTELISGSKHRISDSYLTASTSYGGAGSHGPARSRLNTKDDKGKAGAWCAIPRTTDQWIQADFRKYVAVSGIATQGRHLRLSEWVTYYYVQYHDGQRWVTYQEGGSNKLFRGNRDRDSVVKHTFKKPVVARYIRLNPRSWNQWICLRWEVYGCALSGCYNVAMISGSGSNRVDDCQLSASSQYYTYAPPKNSRLNTRTSGSKWGAWCAGKSTYDQWIQVDFKTRLLVSAIGTQGRYYSYNKRRYYTVYSYQIRYSDDGYTWKTYSTTFSGSYYSNSVAKTTLSYPILARYIRLNPRGWYNLPCLRWEVYGCKL